MALGTQGSADRILAATAECERIEFWHTDTVLKKLTGFPHRYFSNPSNTRQSC